MPWRPLPLSYAVAVYPFQPGPSPSELPLQIGDQLYVIEEGGKDGSWCRGYLVAPPSILSALSPSGRGASDARVFSGIFPKCCIEVREELDAGISRASTVSPESNKPQAPVPMLKIGDDSPTSSTEPLVDEISSCLREWYVLHVPDLVLNREYDHLDRVSNITTRLDYARRQLLNNVLTTQERAGVREEAVWNLVRGNKMLSGEVIVRDPRQLGKLLTSDDSAIEMAKLQSTMSLLDSPPVSKPEKTTVTYHCLLEVKSVTGTDLDTVTLSLGLFFKATDGTFSALSETHISPATADMRTLLSDFSRRVVGSDGQLYLVVKVIAIEPPKTLPKRAPLERSPTSNGTVKVKRDILLARRRSSLMFGSKQKIEKPQSESNGRATPASERAPTPMMRGSEDDERSSKSSKDFGPPLPRTIGVGLIDIARVFRGNKEEDASVTIWTTTNRDEERMHCEDDIEKFLHSRSGNYTICNRLSQVQLHLNAFTASDSQTLIRANPTLLHGVGRTLKMGFSEAPTTKRSDIYLTLCRPHISQGSQLSHPEAGTVSIKSTSLLNLQLTMEVRDASGRRIEHCIYGASNSAGVTAFRTNATEIGSSWDQTICIRLPTDKIPQSHLVLSVADAPEFPFALAWMPLWDKQAFTKNGKHFLILHAYDKSTSSIVGGKGAYMSLPWDIERIATRYEGVVGAIASLEIETRLVSTEISQNRVVVTLLNWKQQSSAQLLDVLQKLVFVEEIEIICELNHVLDALFAILAHKSGEGKFEDLIFNDIVFVFGIVNDRRYNLRPLINEYIENHFDAPMAASSFVRSFTRLLQSVSDPQSARDMRALFKVGSKVIKVIMTSFNQRRPLSPSGNLDKKHSTFKEDMQAVLFGLQMMMRSETPALVGSKTLLIQSFHTWLPELLAVYAKREVVSIAIDFVDACDEATGRLALHRLILILKYTQDERLWIDPHDHETLTENCARWLSSYWTPDVVSDEWREQVRLCCSIVASLSALPSAQLHSFLPELISTYCLILSAPPPKQHTLSLFFPQTYPFDTKPATSHTDRYDEVLLELASLISTIFSFSSPVMIEGPPAFIRKFITSTLRVLQSLLTNAASPSTWLSLHIYNHSAAFRILTYLNTLLATHFLPHPDSAEDFDMGLWKSYFDALLSLVSSPSLSLELFPEQKRRAVWKIAGDVRQSGADLLRRSWESLGWEASTDDQRRYGIRKLGGFQVQYVPSLVGPIIELCLSMHEGLRHTAVQILQTMIVSEWALSEDLDLIETETIGALNNALKGRSRQGGAEVMARKLFVGELLDMFNTIANQPDDALWTALEELVGTVEELIDLLGADDDTAEDQVDDRDERKASVREEHNAAAGNDAGEEVAGMRSTSRVAAHEKAYGEHALEMYKQLADEYERNGDYRRLAKTHRAIARIHEARAMSRTGGKTNGHEVGSEDDE